MAGSFTDLGIRDELVEAAETLGFREPTPLQRAAIPVLRRGGNAVLSASSGAGVRAAYGLPLLDRLASEDARQDGAGPAALVVVATDHLMSRTAAALARLARGLPVRVRALGTDWGPVDEADVLVATASALLDAVNTSRIKLESLRVLVLDGATALFDLGGGEALETVAGIIPKDAQRVLTTAEENGIVRDFVERHVRRPLHIPARNAEEPAAAVPTSSTMSYIVVGEARKSSALSRWISAQDASELTIVCRSDERATYVRDELEMRGLAGEGAATVVGPDGELTGRIVSYDVPFDGDELRRRHESGGIVLVEPGELPHLRRIAAEAALALRAQNVLGPSARDDVETFREMLRQAIREEDLSAQLLLLEPVLEEFSGAEVAAAASALLRRRSGSEPARAPAAPSPQGAATAAATKKGAPAGPAPQQAFVRLFISVGKRDDVRPGDLVGAITGEANVPGDQVGKIEIRDTFSIVEVATGVADRVIRSLNGSTLKSRSIRADYDRRGSEVRPVRRGPRGG